MNGDTTFVDFYSRLQIDPSCDHREIELAFHRLAKIYHPDAGESADIDRFSEVTEAYRALRDPDAREAFDEQYRRATGSAFPGGRSKLHADDVPDAARDAKVHTDMLLQLYRKRRNEPSDPGINGWLLQETLGCTPTQFEFHVWYLKAKGFLHTTEQGTIAITIEGVDHVLANARLEEGRKLLFAPSEQAG